ncbi:MAG: inositol monophosphatase family protein [Myxococcota bacterium]
MNTPFDQVADAIQLTAQEEILPRFRALGDDDVRTKQNAYDLVTVADEAAEARLRERLTALLPGSITVGEEAVSNDPSLLDRLQRDDDIWIIDPVDGTWNFAHGTENFCVMVALARGKTVIAAWIHEPLRRRTVWAERGGGAWLLDLDAGLTERLSLPTPPPLAAQYGFAYHQRLNPGAPMTVKKLGSAGVEYVQILTGEAHFSTYDRSYPWDHAPGSLLITEAGGGYGFVDGAPYQPGGGHQRGVLTAARPALWAHVRDALLTPTA